MVYRQRRGSCFHCFSALQTMLNDCRSSWPTALFETIHPRVTCITGKPLHPIQSPGSLGLLTETRQAVTPKLLWAALTDYDIWPIYLLGFTWTTPNQCVVAYLTLILRSLKFDPFETNLLTVPAWTLFILQLLFWTWLSERINNRYVIILACQIYMLPVLIGLETLGGGQAHAWARYALSVMMVGFPYVHAIIGTLASIPARARREE